MFRCLSTALLFATAATLLPLAAHAGFKSGAAVHPMVAPTIQPPRQHTGVPASSGNRSHVPSGTHDKSPQGFHKFSHHRHRHQHRFFSWPLPIATGPDAYYGSYYPADEGGDIDPALLSGYGPFPGARPEGAFYRTGCRSEEVSVPGSRGPTQVTVTRCSIPLPEPPPLK